MKRLFITALMATMMAMSHAQNAPTTRFLSEHNALTKVSTAQRYLLLPVEESQDNAQLRVLQNNRELKTLNVRLALTKVDYYVPLLLDEFEEGEVLLDVVFKADRHSVGSIKGYTCWKTLHTSDTFDTTNRERFRPAYHFTPQYGWMNDPNGMFYKDGVYHLYFQHNPYGSQWENMTWGHATSTDLIHWKQHPNAIEPDALGTIFSGSCVVDKHNTAGYGKDAVIAYYTSAGTAQTQSLAYSTDNGMTFTKDANNPRLTADIPDFRDPRMFWNEDIKAWNLIMSAGQEMRIYSSPNLKDWKYESSFGKEYGNHDGVWECPDLLHLPIRGTNEKRWVLICNINPGGPFGGNATQYFIGTFDGRRFVCDDAPTVTKWMDYGKDHYAAVTFANAPNNRAISLAWMSNWQYGNVVPTKQYRSAMAIPRDLDLFRHEGKLYLASTPSPELLALRGKPTVVLTKAGKKQLFATPRGAYELVLDLDAKPTATTLELRNEKGEFVTIAYDAVARTLSVDRRKSGQTDFSQDFPAVTTAPVYGQLRQLRIFIDHSSIEVLDAEGRTALTNIVFPSKPYNIATISQTKRGSVKLTAY